MERNRHFERLASCLFLVIILVAQYLIISKFWCLFADYSDASFQQFIRNFHMSGFDPITYDVITRWHQGWDILRHPLLAIAMYPLYLLNQLLRMFTGCNCVQLICGVMLTLCGFYSVMFVYRTIAVELRAPRWAALLLSLLFLGFAYILVSIIVPDHFCLSMFCLTLTVYLAAGKLNRGERFSVLEALFLFLLTAGITLTNGAVVLFVVMMVNGREFFRWHYLLKVMVLPVVFLMAMVVVQTSLSAELRQKKGNLVEQQMRWTKDSAPKVQILQENFFGESLQLHRKHILGDVLRDRPVVVPYTWQAQNYVELCLLLLLVAGVVAGIRKRLTLILLGILAFNIMLHIVMAFAIEEVYIMTAHWAFVIPLAIAPLFRLRQRWAVVSVAILLLAITIYLYAYHGYLLHRYLTWPLV